MDSFKQQEQVNQSHIPLYLRVCDWLRKHLDSPDVVKAGKLPPESELSERLGVSRKTLRHSLDILAKDGLIKRVKNRGTILTSRMSPSDPHSVKCVGVVFPVTRAWDDVISMIKREFSSRGYNLRMYLYEWLDLEDEKKALNLARKECSGLLIHPSLTLQDQDTIKQLAATRFPLVIFGSAFDSVICDMVALDDYRRGYQLTEALLSEGRKRIVYISQEIYRNWPPELQKVNGYKRAIAVAGVESDGPHVIYGNSSGNNITEKVTELDPDGIITSNAFFSFALMSELLRRGKKIPGDVRLARFNTPKELPSYNDAMFVISDQNEAFSEALVSVLCDRIDNPNRPYQRVYIGAELIVNER